MRTPDAIRGRKRAVEQMVAPFYRRVKMIAVNSGAEYLPQAMLLQARSDSPSSALKKCLGTMPRQRVRGGLEECRDHANPP